MWIGILIVKAIFAPSRIKFGVRRALAFGNTNGEY